MFESTSMHRGYCLTSHNINDWFSKDLQVLKFNIIGLEIISNCTIIHPSKGYNRNSETEGLPGHFNKESRGEF